MKFKFIILLILSITLFSFNLIENKVLIDDIETVSIRKIKGKIKIIEIEGGYAIGLVDKDIILESKDCQQMDEFTKCNTGFECHLCSLKDKYKNVTFNITYKRYIDTITDETTMEDYQIERNIIETIEPIL